MPPPPLVALSPRAMSAAAQHTSAKVTAAAACDPPMPSLLSVLKSWLTSPATMAVLATTKQTALAKRKYVGQHTADIIDLCICIASVIGSLSIIIPYCLNKRSRKLRHSLILGLATSDLVSSLVIGATTSFQITGGDLTNATKFCNFAGYAFASSIWTQHFWNLSIASITYIILVYPLSPIVNQVERHLVWLWPIFWSISMIANGIAWGIAGWRDQDGYCTLNPYIHGDFSAIFAFVPRAIVVIVILVLYTHLFFFLRRVNFFSGSMTSKSSRRGATSNDLPAAHSQNQAGMRAFEIVGSGHGDAAIENEGGEGQEARHFGSLGRTASVLLSKVRRANSSTSRTAPSTLVAAESSSKRNGSSSTQGKASSSAPPTSLTDNLQRMDYNDPSEVSPTTVTSDMQASISSTDEPVSPKTQSKPLLQRQVPSHATPRPSPLSPTQSRPLTAPTRTSDDGVSAREESDDSDNEGVDVDAELFAPMSVRRDVRDFGMTSPPQEHLKHYSLSPAGVKIAKRAQAEHVAAAAAASSERVEEVFEGQEAGEKPREGLSTSVTYDDLLGGNWSWGMAVGQTAGGRGSGASTTKKAGEAGSPLGVARVNTSATTTNERQKPARANRWRPWSSKIARGENSATTVSTTSSSDENGVETTGSKLNRQASVLLLLYPAAYVLLFSVSIIRFFVDVTTPKDQRDPLRSSDALHSIARWTIFAQGAIDAFVFQLIERQFRRRMKRRRRIAAGEKVDDSWAYKAYQWMRSSITSLRRPSEDVAKVEREEETSARQSV